MKPDSKDHLGVTGATGPQGPKGEKGATGATGQRGPADTGPAGVETCPADTGPAGVETCPADTGPAGFETCPADTGPAGFETCPAETDQAGHLVMGEGDLTTTDELLPFCNLEDAEICAEGTQLKGILVDNTDAIDDGLETACNTFNICPVGTELAGVVINSTTPDTTPADGIPDICTVQGLETCPGETDQAGHFVIADGNLATNEVIDPDLATFGSLTCGNL